QILVDGLPDESVSKAVGAKSKASGLDKSPPGKLSKSVHNHLPSLPAGGDQEIEGELTSNHRGKRQEPQSVGWDRSKAATQRLLHPFRNLERGSCNSARPPFRHERGESSHASWRPYT